MLRAGGGTSENLGVGFLSLRISRFLGAVQYDESVRKPLAVRLHACASHLQHRRLCSVHPHVGPFFRPQPLVLSRMDVRGLHTVRRFSTSIHPPPESRKEPNAPRSLVRAADFDQTRESPRVVRVSARTGVYGSAAPTNRPRNLYNQSQEFAAWFFSLFRTSGTMFKLPRRRHTTWPVQHDSFTARLLCGTQNAVGCRSSHPPGRRTSIKAELDFSTAKRTHSAKIAHVFGSASQRVFHSTYGWFSQSLIAYGTIEFSRQVCIGGV